MIAMDNDFTLPKSFWTGFTREFWDKGPTLIRQPFAKPFASAEEVFDILLRSAEDYRDMSRKVPIHIYVDNAMRQSDAGYFMPRREDSSLSQFARRIKSELGERAYTLAAFGCQFYNASVWMRARDFFQGLYEEVGLPIGFADLEVFCGSYERTPTGIHRDTASSFSYVVEGRKKMMFWPPEAFDEQIRIKLRYLGTDEYERFTRGASVIEGEPGDIIFWPASYWHLAISDGGWPTTLNLSLYFEHSHFFFLQDAFQNGTFGSDLLRAASAPTTFPFRPEAGLEDGDVPECIAREIELIRAVGQSPNLFAALKEVWLKRLAASGFATVPPPRPARPLTDNDVIFGDARYPVRLMRADDGAPRLIANGYTLRAPAASGLQEVLKIVNSGEPTSVGELLKRVSWRDARPETDVETQSEVRALLEHLYSVRAIELA